MSRRPASTQSTGDQSSILDDITGFFSKLWHGITSFFSSIFGGSEKKVIPPRAPEDQAELERRLTSRENARGPRADRRQDFMRAANYNSGGWANAGANGMSFASASNGDYFSQVSRVSSRFNGNSFGYRESFAPAFASHGGFQGGGMRLHCGGGGMHCGGGRRH